MCGICGKIDFYHSKVDSEIIDKMTDSLTYRGPDDKGVFTSGHVALGHRRLSIIDLSSSGNQPMSNEDESIWLVFNGEIYDFQEHRKNLKEKGHTLKSRTDTEVLIHLYEDQGVDCINNINGMFAFAIWDKRYDRIFLGRDRLGIKPLHYFWDGRTLIFASEIKAILRDPFVSRDMDRDALDLYLTLNYIPGPKTIYNKISKLEPGSYLLAEKGNITIKKYWDILNDSYKDRREIKDFEDAKESLYGLVENSVKRRLISDVPLGAFLSGGIDSSIIVALMAKNSLKPVKTFSIGYKDIPSFDETGYAEDVAKFHRTEHRRFRLGYRDMVDAIPQVLELIDEPFADSSAIPTYIVSRETRNHVTVAMSGDGGDELFAGYRMYKGERWASAYGTIPHFIREYLIKPVITSFPDARDKPALEKIRRIKKFITGMSNSFPERYYNWREVFPYTMRRDILLEPPGKNLYLKYVAEKIDAVKSIFPDDRINLMLYMDLTGLLNNDMLTKVDRMSMANSLEVRVPLLDHTVAEYTFMLDGNMKLKWNTGKYILMETFKKLLPASLHNRPKAGFEVPIGAWLRNELKFLIDEYLGRDQIKRQKIFNYDVVDMLIQDHMSSRRDTSWHLWNLIVFQYWFRKYM